MLLVLTKNKINVTIISRGHMLSDRHVMKGMTMFAFCLCLNGWQVENKISLTFELNVLELL